MSDHAPFSAAVIRALNGIRGKMRQEIIQYLAEGQHSVKELAKAMDLDTPTVSHHLRKLLDLHLVEMEQDGKAHRYTLSPRVSVRSRPTYIDVIIEVPHDAPSMILIRNARQRRGPRRLDLRPPQPGIRPDGSSEPPGSAAI